MELNEKKIKENVVYNGNFLTIRQDHVQLPNEKIATRELVEHPGAACILAIDEDDNILMVKQYRYPIGKLMYEVPAGKLDPNEEPINCAYRELEEETGYKAKDLELIGILYPAPAYTTEILYIYLAKEIFSGQMNLDEDEFLVCEKLKFDQVLAMIMNGEITDAKTQIAVLKYSQMKQNKSQEKEG